MAVNIGTPCVFQTLLFLTVTSGLCSCFVVRQSTCRAPLTCIPVQDCRNRLNGLGIVHNSVFFECASGTLQNRRVCCSPAKKKMLLPTEDCGLMLGDRVLGGRDALLGQFPWMALLGYTMPNSTGPEFRCGGTLISDRYVLTAAHCLQDSKMPTFVRLGEHNMKTDVDCTCEGYPITDDCEVDPYCADPVIDNQIVEAIRHEDHDTTPFKNDIGLLRLQSKVEFTDFVNPICLPFGVNLTGEEEANYTVAGWGKTDNYMDSPQSDILQFVLLRSTPLKDCVHLKYKPGDGQLCTGQGGKDACRGDSGGPMSNYYSVPVNATFRVFQIGIVSYRTGPWCGSENTSTIFTRVTTYLDWILDHIHE